MRYPLMMIAIFPNVGSAAFKVIGPSYLREEICFPSTFEGLSVTPGGAVSNRLAVMYCTQKIVDDFIALNIVIASLYWWILDETGICRYKSASATIPPIGSPWSINQAISSRNLYRTYQAKI